MIDQAQIDQIEAEIDVKKSELRTHERIVSRVNEKIAALKLELGKLGDRRAELLTPEFKLDEDKN